ncbi:MAG: preprotein translocase subunit SecG [Alphaproteobacteria bacterium]|nr:preprotein translocase subunit SecG [Alphaproteobacteria bacterium]
MENVLLVIHMIIAVALICVVLMQRSAQDGGGLMGGGSTMGGLFTARGSANLLTRTTSVLATLFMVLSLVQGIIAAQSHSKRSLVEQIEPLAVPATSGSVSTTTAPAAPAAPASVPYEAPSVPVSK